MFKEWITFKATAFIFRVAMAVWLTMLMGCHVVDLVNRVETQVQAEGRYSPISSVGIIQRSSPRLLGLIDGRRAAQSDHQTGEDCVLSVVSSSYLCEHEVPTHRLRYLREKPDSYVLAYKQAYVKESKRLHKSQRFWAKQSDGRWIVGFVVIVILIVGAAATS